MSTSRIEAFGQKIPTADILDSATVEADVLLTDGTFIDMKHSLGNDPYITQTQINNLKTLLSEDSPRITRAVFVTNAEVSDPIKTAIAQANADLVARGKSDKLITYIVKGDLR